VSHRKDIAYTVGAKAHDVFVPRVVNHAFEGDVSLFNDDSDWFVHTERVTIQRSATVNGSEKPQPKIVIKRRSGKNLNPVVDALHSLNLFHHVFSIRLQNWARYLLQEGDVISIHSVCEIVEHAQIRQHDQFMPDVLLYAFDGAW